MHQEAREELRVRFKLTVLEYATHLGVTTACREFSVPRSTFYGWKQKYDHAGQSACIEEGPSPIAIRRTSPEIVEDPGTPQRVPIGRFTDHVLSGAYHGSRFQNPRCLERCELMDESTAKDSAQTRARTKRYAKRSQDTMFSSMSSFCS